MLASAVTSSGVVLPVVPRVFPGSTLVCLAPGPSLCQVDLDLVRQSGHPTIAVNNAILHAPWASVYYAADLNWWQWHADVLPRAAVIAVPCYGLQPEIREHFSQVVVLNRTGPIGIDPVPTNLRTGGHSGYQAINLAVHLGARRIVLLGYDLLSAIDTETGHKIHHAFGVEHPDHRHLKYDIRVPVYRTLAEPLVALGICLVNASRRSAIDAVPRMSLREALQCR